MGGFKLVAIQILQNCFSDARKMLPIGELYKFYANYEFKLDDTKNVVSIELLPDEGLGIYNLKREGQEDLLVSISAIVGKNGSGKSTILELFYAFCLCISKDLQDIKTELEKLGTRFPFKREYIQTIFNHLHVEIFYEIEGNIKSIRYAGISGVSTFKFDPKRKDETSFDLNTFGYTIAVNYSIYGLNEINAPWLIPMFHKNDGYQAPLVINPYRDEGNIDINSEYHLANSRLLQNIGLYNHSNPEIINGQKLHSIGFSFEPKALDKIYYQGKNYDLTETINYYENKSNQSIYDLYNELTAELVGGKIPPSKIDLFNQFKRNGTQVNISNYENNLHSSEKTSAHIEYWFTRYVIKKLFKICLQYSWFREKHIEFDKYNDLDVIGIKDEGDLIKTLLGNKSHVTLKLRQAVFMWQKRYFFENVIWGANHNKNNSDYFACSCKLDSSQLIEASKDSTERKTLKEKFDLENIPGGILKPEIHVIRDSANTGQKIEKLSSGEQQFLFTLQTIIYHIKNIDSVFDADYLDRGSIIAYRNVMIILDEVELYFHPEFQRKFIYELLSQIAQIDIRHISSINILFSTHSPFLLSDIKSTNILKIKDGIAQKYNNAEQTFGANVHDLLANDFFMENGFMGEWAKYIISDLVLFLTGVENDSGESKKQWTETTAKTLISSIGEPILKMRLERLFDKKFVEHDKILIQKRIEELQAKLLK